MKLSLTTKVLIHLSIATSVHSYCNWNGCSGVPQGSSDDPDLAEHALVYCNKDIYQCQENSDGCRGTWCTNAFSYCSFHNSCDGVIHSTEWCNAEKNRCENHCRGTWCTNGNEGAQSTQEQERQPIRSEPQLIAPTNTRGPKKVSMQPQASSSSKHTNDCMRHYALDQWDNYWGKCKTYVTGSPNHDYCDEDVDNNNVLAEVACSECGKCQGPNNMCVAFSTHRPFNAGWGECDTYAQGITNSNYDWCDYDEDNGIKASEACSECNNCVKSNPRTVRVRARWLKCVNKGDEPGSNKDVEIYGEIGSQVGIFSRTFWREDAPSYVSIDEGKQFYNRGTHYYEDVGDSEDITVKGILYEHDFKYVDDILGKEKETFNVGKLFYERTTTLVQLNWSGREGTKITGLFSIEVT